MKVVNSMNKKESISLAIFIIYHELRLEKLCPTDFEASSNG